MPPIEDQIREVRTAISQATARKTRAEIEKEAAQARLDEATATLQDEFNVSSREEARDILLQLQRDLQEEIAAAEEKLAEAEA
jgi:hypothetical protein